jgi:NADH dehydrogenase (ubiquinone) 1 beta subcomplex subunit 7
MSSTTASQEELKAHRVPLGWRDQCSAYVLFLCALPEPSLNQSTLCVHVTKSLCRYVYSLLLPLNVCRKDKYYLPWECENERHAYEKCVSSCLSTLRLFILLTKQQLLHGRCQYDEYVSFFLHIGPYINLRVFISQLYSQNEGTLQAETSGEGGCSGLIIDGDHVFYRISMQFVDMRTRL